MGNVQLQSPTVSIDWLLENMDASNLIILDGTIGKVTSNNFESVKSSKKQIKNALFLDIKLNFSEQKALFPNTMLSANNFEKAARQLGINNDSILVVYDDLGIYSSARVWWMFKSMGFENIAVLDGGFPEWEKAGYPTEETKLPLKEEGDFTATYNNSLINDYKEVLNAITDKNAIVMDARSEERFKGLIEEPRKGLRRGHIPTSKNLPYSKLVVDYKMISQEKLSNVFSELMNKEDRIIFSCGTGITACILALGAELIGLQNKSVYDGSWTEWGSMGELPISRG